MTASSATDGSLNVSVPTKSRYASLHSSPRREAFNQFVVKSATICDRKFPIVLERRSNLVWCTNPQDRSQEHRLYCTFEGQHRQLYVSVFYRFNPTQAAN